MALALRSKLFGLDLESYGLGLALRFLSLALPHLVLLQIGYLELIDCCAVV